MTMAIEQPFRIEGRKTWEVELDAVDDPREINGIGMTDA